MTNGLRDGGRLSFADSHFEARPRHTQDYDYPLDDRRKTLSLACCIAAFGSFLANSLTSALSPKSGQCR